MLHSKHLCRRALLRKVSRPNNALQPTRAWGFAFALKTKFVVARLSFVRWAAQGDQMKIKIILALPLSCYFFPLQILVTRQIA